MTVQEGGVTWVVCNRRAAVSTEIRGWAAGGCSSTPPELQVKGSLNLPPGTRFHPAEVERVSKCVNIDVTVSTKIAG